MTQPARAILDVAADLIIVGSRGLAHGTRFLRGSVSSRIANHAQTSFLVIHDNGTAQRDKASSLVVDHAEL